MIIGVLKCHHTNFSHLAKLLLVKYKMLIIGILNLTITPIFTFSRASISEIQKCLPEAICCCIARFSLIYHNVDHWCIKHYTGE